MVIWKKNTNPSIERAFVIHIFKLSHEISNPGEKKWSGVGAFSNTAWSYRKNTKLKNADIFFDRNEKVWRYKNIKAFVIL